MRHERITDEVLEVLHFMKYDLYKWKCAVPGCTNGRKVRMYDINNQDLQSASYYIRAVLAYNSHPENEPLQLYADVRSSGSKWIHKNWWLMCGKHWKLYRRPVKSNMPEELTKERGVFILLNKDLTESNKYSIIQKLHK